MLGILADYADTSLSLNYLALFAHRFYGNSNLHSPFLLSACISADGL